MTSTADKAILNQTIVANGSYYYSSKIDQETTVFWNITGPIVGTSPTLQFTLSETDPNDNITVNGQVVSSETITSVGVGSLTISFINSSLVTLSWTVAGDSASFGGVSVSITGKPVASNINNQGEPAILPNSWPVKITDAINGPVSVKAASTAAAVDDSSLVVAISPNLSTTATLSSIVVNASANGDNILITGVSSQTIRVFRVILVFSAGGTAIIKDDASTALTGPLALSVGSSIVLDIDRTNPWFITSLSNSFILNLTGGAAAGGIIYYTQS